MVLSVANNPERYLACGVVQVLSVIAKVDQVCRGSGRLFLGYAGVGSRGQLWD